MVKYRMKYLRLQRGYSISKLSEKTGISKSYLSYIERGIQKNPSLHILSRLANSLDTTLEDLLDDHKQQTELDEKWIDEEWMQIFSEAIEHGITKEDFSLYIDFIKFKRSNKDQ
ncbi:helix-turn-helix domain-containing protein [Bacillus sp. V3B]|uniref:helix-turn-helix domain-containing protein n=1 Tax=Bacillus sp. V3B TaxID=2804915 RepID=UPI00210D019E|nr:helix-turn-helix domain-containing protein [Bacillus sp. V3B]MCQ6275199.1 helix-turn-helix domain-containing protein [Bacillus sp. V3B]